MLNLNMFSNIPPVGHLYFFYGLAFLFLGISIVFKDVRSSELSIARNLWLLAMFGFTHGAHEWLDLYLLLQGKYISANEFFWIELIAIILVIFSFLFLLQFGLSLVRTADINHGRWLKVIPPALFLVWIIYLLNIGLSVDIQFFKKADMSARMIFGFVGGLMTSYGLRVFSFEVKNLGRSVTRKLFYAGIIFALYSILAGLVPSHTVIPYLQVRVEVLRGISAVLIAYFIIKALNIFDIETKRRMEKQLKRVAQSEKLVSLGQLAAGIAHEINNPLTNISLNIQMLKDETKEADYAGIMERLDSMDKNVSKASTIAKELLLFSRKAEPQMSPVNINTVITGALTLMEHKFKGVTLHKNLSSVADIMGEAAKLEQVFINILDNSVESMSVDKHICIECSYDKGWINVKIADSGMGIPKENMLKVFDPFFTTKEIGAGTGLGLSICYGIITQHNGNMSIESVQNEGTVVTIMIPAVDAKL